MAQIKYIMLTEGEEKPNINDNILCDSIYMKF